MRTRTQAILCAFAAMLMAAGCNGKKAKEITQEDYNLLRSINESISDTSSAVNLALGTKSTVSPHSAEKVSKLVDLLKSSNCDYSTDDKEPGGTGRYTSDWTSTQTVKPKSGPCVLALNQAGVYVAAARKFTFTQVFSTSGDFQKESVVQSYTVEGNLKAEEINTRTRIVGTYNFKNFRVRGHGLIGAQIRTVQNYSGNSGAGMAKLMIDTGPNEYTADVSWSASGTVSYRLNGRKVDAKVMDELFSAYGLMEIVDRSTRMR